MIWLDNSRIVAIFAVVFLHSAAIVVTGTDVGTMPWWIGNSMDSIVRWCVPVFVMISGALLLDPEKDESLRTFYSKRISKVFIPVLFWTLFFLCCSALKGFLQGEPVSLLHLLQKVASGRPHHHMWFLYMILPLYLFTPFLRKIAAHSTRKELLLFVLLSFICAALYAINIAVTPKASTLFIYWFLSYIPYYVLGRLIREDRSSHSIRLLWFIFTLSCILTALGCYWLTGVTSRRTGMYFYSYLSVTVIPMSVSLMYLLKRWNKPLISNAVTKRLASLTLGIYVIHPLFLEAAKLAGYSPVRFNPVWSIPVTAIVVTLFSLLSAYIISRIKYLDRVI